MPVDSLASRDWDAIVVGGGHNGLTAATYLAQAGKSVLVLERRERLGGACTLERPFDDDRFVVSPCAYVVGLLDEVVIERARLRRPRAALLGRRSEPLGALRGRQLRSASGSTTSGRSANLEELGVSEADKKGYWAYEELFDEVRIKLRKGARDTWVGDTPTRAEIEEMLDGNQTMIDLVFEASIAEVLDDHIGDERLKTALYGQGIIGTWGGPWEPGTASIKLMHYQGDLEGQGPVWGYVEGGMGMVSFAIAEAARESGAVLACGVPVSAIHPGEGVELEDGTRLRSGTVLCNADPKRLRGMLEGSDVDDAFTRRLDEWKVRSPVVKFNAALERLPTWTAAAGDGWAAHATIDVRGSMQEAQRAFETCAAGEPAVAFGEIYIQTGVRPDPGPRGQAPAQRLRPVRALRDQRRRLGLTPRRRRQAVRRPDLALRAGPAGLPDRPRGARSSRHREADRSDRRQHLPGRGHSRPDVGGPPQRPHADSGSLSLWRGDPSGGERDRSQRAERRRGRPRGLGCRDRRRRLAHAATGVGG